MAAIIIIIIFFFIYIARPVIDLNWKIAHGVLYTADRTISFGYSLPLSCFCGFPCEFIDHLFLACPLAQSVLSWLQTLMSRWCSLAPSLVLRHARFGFNGDESSRVPKNFAYILNVYKYYLWLARNDFRFLDVGPSAVDVLVCVSARLRFYLPIFFRRVVHPVVVAILFVSGVPVISLLPVLVIVS